MNLRLSTLALTVLILAAGCGTQNDNGVQETRASKTKVTHAQRAKVTVTEYDPDNAFVAATNAEVLAEDGPDGTSRSYVTLSVKTSSRSPSSRRYFFGARVDSMDGTRITCTQRGMGEWKEFGVFEDVHLLCDSTLDVARVDSVTAIGYF